MKYFVGQGGKKRLGANLLPRSKSCVMGTWKGNVKG